MKAVQINNWVSLNCLIVLLSFTNCQVQNQNMQFDGSEQAVALANEMYEAIGGSERWCALRSLYIKAEHTEPQMTIPYQSEIWRGIDTFQVIIEQQSDSFHVKAIFTDQGGTIHYLDDRDTLRTLSEEQLASWKFGNKHNVYVLLHDLACEPSAYTATIEGEELVFYQNVTFIVRFGLDEMNRPHLFYHPTANGEIVGSRFTQWGTDQGLVHSAGGHPLDSNFLYVTEEWVSSEQSLMESFGTEIFDIP